MDGRTGHRRPDRRHQPRRWSAGDKITLQAAVARRAAQDGLTVAPPIAPIAAPTGCRCAATGSPSPTRRTCSTTSTTSGCHLYLSPILTAAGRPTTATTSSTPPGVARARRRRRARPAVAGGAGRGLGIVVDIVPNHVGVDDPRQNPWWWDVLRHGRESPYAPYFDIDWTLDPDGRIVLPVLGSDDDVDALTVDGDVLRLDARAWPIAPGTGSGSGSQVHDRQHYRLVGWRHNVCGYRRFFAITSLAALRRGPRRVRRHPRRGQALVHRGTRRRRAHRPSGRPGESGGLPRVAARAHRAAARGS